MYQMKSRVRYSECGPDDKLTIAALINYFQDCSNENSERLGVGVDYLYSKKRAWVLNTWQVAIHRYPRCGEEIEIFTWATGFKGVFGPRDFCMKTPEGEVLACAHTLWVYVDTQTGKPTKPEQEEIDTYGFEEPLEMETVSRKIKVPEGMTVVDTFPVRKYHIDTNHHVNNSQYIQMATEVVSDGFSVTGLRVEYKKAAVYGETLVLKYVEEQEKIVAMLCDEDENPYAIIEFTGEK